MSSYSELIKSFERIRSYMREFYVYGFKSREEYNRKSARSYDDERRRIESWLGDYFCRDVSNLICGICKVVSVVLSAKYALTSDAAISDIG